MQATIVNTICRRGWARLVRPPRQFTSELKRRQLAALGYADRRMRDYEEDHLIPLELGGSPADPRNLWPEPRQQADGWDASKKDELEDFLHQAVCNGRMRLNDAQRALTTDWRASWRRYATLN